MEDNRLYKIFWCSMKQCWCKYADTEDHEWCSNCLSANDIEVGNND